MRGTIPFAVNNGWDIKYHLCKSAILEVKIFTNIDPDSNIILVKPLVKIYVSELQNDVNKVNKNQFQTMDIIAGRICPELGGSENLLEILGFNYY